MRLCFLLGSALLAAGLSTSAFADTLTVTESGVFSASTPVTSYSAPNQTFTIRFNVDSMPTVTNVATGLYFTPAVTNFTYLLNGNVASNPTATVFFSAADAGLMNICFISSCSGNQLTNGLSIQGPQVYTGTEAAPMILRGSFAPTFGSVFVNGTGTVLASEANVNIVSAQTPEPSSIALLATGLFGVAGVLRRRLA